MQTRVVFRDKLLKCVIAIEQLKLFYLIIKNC